MCGSMGQLLKCMASLGSPISSPISLHGLPLLQHPRGPDGGATHGVGWKGFQNFPLGGLIHVPSIEVQIRASAT